MPSSFKLLMILSTPSPSCPITAIHFARHSRMPLEALSSTVASRGRFFSMVPFSKFGFSPARPQSRVLPNSLRVFDSSASLQLSVFSSKVISPPFPPISRKPTRRLASSSISGHGISPYFPSSQLEEEVHKGPINGDFPKVGFEEKYKWGS